MDPTAIFSLITEALKLINNTQAGKPPAQIKAEALFWLLIAKPLIYWALNKDQKAAFDKIEAALQPTPETPAP